MAKQANGSADFDACYDYVIAGGGSAGCVLAERLSANGTRRVLLIEAGPDVKPGREPATIKDTYPRSYSDPRFQWSDFTINVRDSDARRRPVEQGRVLGGSSSIMGMVALRGLPGDYDEWSEYGLTDWGWKEVLPNFIRIEHDHDFSDGNHGSSGPIDVRRHGSQLWPPFCRAVADALGDEPRLPDMNSDFRSGLGALPLSVNDAGRVSASIGFLTDRVRKRSNLRVAAESTVESLLMEGRQVKGVQARIDGRMQRVRAGEVILSMGALRSPAMLMRAGIGDGAYLSGEGVQVVVDRRGVGANLRNHPALYIAVTLKGASRQSKSLKHWGMNALRFSSDAERADSDMMMFVLNKTSWHAVGRRIGSLMVSVYKSYSTGYVRLADRDPASPPDVRMRLLSDERDIDRLTRAVRMAYSILQAPHVRSTYYESFASPSGKIIRRMQAPGYRSAVMGEVGAALMDLSSPLRQRFARTLGADLAPLVDTDKALREYVFEHAVPLAHYVGTCRMGRVDDPDAVVDSEGRVIGVTGLRVVDGSILPTLPRANTNFPIMMVADRVSEKILRTTGSARI
jgi:5-(hydroxymethyl)furfural/furfural oxidase